MSKASSLPVNQDNRFWVEGIQAGRLLIQHCLGCGTLRQPPQPMCGRCQSFEWDSIEASGRGRVHSYVIHHRPILDGFESPFCVLLVDLDEGVRLVGEAAPPCRRDIAIGDAVEIMIERDDDGDALLPRWAPLTAIAE